MAQKDHVGIFGYLILPGSGIIIKNMVFLRKRKKPFLTYKLVNSDSQSVSVWI
jgi:hypothetical protein